MDYTPRPCPPKRWNAEFLTDRNFKEETPYVWMKGDIQSVFGGVENFMKDSEESLPSDQVDEVVKFCEGVCPDDLRSGVAAASRYRRAWLDDRGYSPETENSPETDNPPETDNSHEMNSGFPRKYNGIPLTPSQLYQILQARRYNNAVMPDADRRLIYITKTSPHYILAITETTPWHEFESLRDALWKHLDFQTSIKVKVLPQTFPIFHMEFHLPYLALRQGPPERHSRKGDNGRNRNWTDLSFLKPRKDNLQQHGVYETQISFVLVGSDNHRWDGYCFAFDEEEDLLDEDSDAICMDPISWNGKSCKIDATRPIWDPRKYFLAVFASRMTQVLAEFECLIRMIAKNIKQYENAPLHTFSEQPQNHTQDAKVDFKRVQLTMRLLGRLTDILSEYAEAWESFSGYEGDLGYFSDIMASKDQSSEQACYSIEVIKQAFVRLQQRKRELSRLEKMCKSSAQILTLAGSNSARNNEIVTGLTASVVNPIALAAAIFSMPDAVKLNPKSFVVAIVISVALMRLLLFIPGVFGWWPAIAARIKAAQWDWRECMKIATTQTRHGADEATYDVEMHPLDSHSCNVDL